jgi:hypothetical protein
MSRSPNLLAIVLMICVSCTGNTQMPGHIEENKKSEEQAALQDVRAQATKKEAIEVAVKQAVKQRLKLSDEKADGLVVMTMPNSERYAGAKEPATGLCFLLVKGAPVTPPNEWQVVQISSKIDEVSARKAVESTEMTMGDVADIQSLAMWAERNCPGPE